MGKNYLTDAGRERLSIAAKGNQYAVGMTYTHTDEAKAAIAASRTGTIMSDESKLKCSINRTGLGTGERNAMASEENRNKVRDSKIGLRALNHPDPNMPSRRVKPGTDKWNELLAEGYLPSV